MKILTKIFERLPFILFGMVLLLYSIAKIFNINIGFGSPNVPITENEKIVVEKYKKMFHTEDVMALHSRNVLLKNNIVGNFDFYMNSEDSVFSFNSIPLDSVEKISKGINSDIQKVLNHKIYYDSVCISIYTSSHTVNNTGLTITFNRDYKYPIKK